MDPITAAALITGGTQMIGSFIGGRRAANVSRTNTDQTIAANKQMAELKWKRDLDMWEMMKKYNDPASQMQRFKEAGLNPHLIYGQGTPGNVQSAPTYQPPNIQYNYQADQGLPSAMQNIPDFQDIGLKEKQIEAQTLDNIAKDFGNDIQEVKSLDAKRRNYLESLLHGAIKDTPVNDIKQYLVDNWVAQMTEKEQNVLRTKLTNTYQKKVNQMLIQEGITPGDSVKIRIGMMILEALGVSQQKLKQILGGN